MREITSHKVNEANETLIIRVTDERGPGGANHHYTIDGFDNTTNPSVRSHPMACYSTELLFQNGPIKEVGVNGITNEALLAVLIDRMEGFQSGPYKCEENAKVLSHLLLAQLTLRQRTRNRIERGVEGTHEI